MKRISVILLFIVSLAFARLNWQPRLNLDKRHKKCRAQTAVSDNPAVFWWSAWTQNSYMNSIEVSNTCQGGVITRPTNWDHYEGQWPFGFSVGNGNLEFPAYSGQMYNWAWGAWFGALYPKVNDKGETTWVKNVSKCAYYTDLGAMSVPEMSDAGDKLHDISSLGLYFSTQQIPEKVMGTKGYYLFAPSRSKPESYQTRWPFADTMINKRRPKHAWVYPDSGDIIAYEETFAVAGDYIPEDNAALIWLRTNSTPYDYQALGIRVEQRTYIWNYAYNNQYMYINYKVRNMNNFPLKNFYVGFFMDNDIGDATDDMIGYLEDLNLGYSYDSDGKEMGWITPAGFIGCVMVETPADSGLTGFNTWIRSLEPGEVMIDDDGTDSLKYDALAERAFKTYEIPRDVRQLSASGPLPELKPGEEVEFTVAIIVAFSLDELIEKAKMAIDQFNTGYLGFAPPPSPNVTVKPGDGVVYVTWDNSPEDYVDLMADEQTFEGYRVYKSRTGYLDDWELVADYDRKNTATPDTVMIKPVNATSNAEIVFTGYDAGAEKVSAQYTVNFSLLRVDTTVIDSTTTEYDTVFGYDIYNIDKKQLYSYSTNEAYSFTFRVKSHESGQIYKTFPGYIPGDTLKFDGMNFVIKNGVPDPELPIDTTPNAGDAYMITSFKSEAIGPEAGIRYFYADSNVVNGYKYYYSVVSYSKPLPKYGVDILEGGKSGKKYWAIPMKSPVNYADVSIDYERISGKGDMRFFSTIVNPMEVKDNEYTVTFNSDEYGNIVSWNIMEGSTPKAESIPYLEGDGYSPVIDGVSFKAYITSKNKLDINDTIIDDGYTHWADSTIDAPILFHEADSLEASDFAIIFTQDGYVDNRHKKYTFKIIDLTTGEMMHCYFIKNNQMIIKGDTITRDSSQLLWFKDKIYVYHGGEYNRNQQFWLEVQDLYNERTKFPEEGDTLYVKTLKKVSSDTKIRITTSGFGTEKDTFSLDSIRVVPNPYYVRAPWDESKWVQKVWFQGLPDKCKIRIFNAAGLQVRVLYHDEPTGAAYWDLYTEEGQRATSGLYFYLVEMENGKKKTGKFSIIY